MEGNPLDYTPRTTDLDFERERLRRTAAELLTFLNEADAEQDEEKRLELDTRALVQFIGLAMDKKYAQLVMNVRSDKRNE